MIVASLCEKCSIKEGEITAAYDGLDSIIMDMDRYTSFYIRYNHFDMLSEIDTKIINSPIQRKWRHVKVHQDEYFGTLDR